MAGFLDKNTRIVDMVLTDYGRELHSQGKLEFTYYAFSDDEVDYDPYIHNSSSLSSTELTSSKEQQIDATLVREAVFGLSKDTSPAGKDSTNIQNLMFTMPQGQTVLPEVEFAPDLTSGSIDTKQQKLQEVFVTLDQFGNIISKLGPFDLGFRKFDGSRLSFDMKVRDFFDRAAHEGYLVRVFTSGSDGLREVKSKRDINNALSYMCDLRLFRDSEIDRLDDSDAKKLESLEDSVTIERKK